MFILLLITLSFTYVDLKTIDKTFQKLPRNEFIEYFNNKNFAYKIKEYNKNFIPKIPCDLKPVIPMINYQSMSISHCKEGSIVLPENFDARLKWPHCETIRDIYDQEISQCGSCWAFATTNTAADRTCIHKNRTVRLSQLDLINARPFDPNTICHGGFPINAYQYWIDEGIVTDTCKPYDLKLAYVDKRRKSCSNISIEYERDKNFGKEVYFVDAADMSIRCELFNRGPLSAYISVYEDYLMYSSGVYEHLFGDLLYIHAIRVIGYGVENSVKYWLAVNSFGTSWGELGLVKIKRFSGLELESTVLGVFPQ